MKTKEDIFETLTLLRAELEGLGVLRIGVFGSFARDQQHLGSDVDLLLEFSTTPGLFRMAEVHLILERHLARRVDIATREMLSPLLQTRVLSEVIYEDDVS